MKLLDRLQDAQQDNAGAGVHITPAQLDRLLRGVKRDAQREAIRAMADELRRELLRDRRW